MHIVVRGGVGSRCSGRVVKALNLKSNGHNPYIFEYFQQLLSFERMTDVYIEDDKMYFAVVETKWFGQQ